jgi:DNA-binding NtrC family response regulator
MENYKILIVEDEHDILNVWKKKLEHEGYTVDIADNGKTALELWEKNIYDVIVVDLRIPEVDGREVINQIKEKQPQTQIIIISGQGKDNDLIDAINKHVFRYLVKPVDLEKIIGTIEDAVKERDPVLIALNTLAEKSPDKPMLFVGRKTFTPKQLYNEVRKNTVFGKEFYDEFLKSLTDFEPTEESGDELLGIKGVIE